MTQRTFLVTGAGRDTGQAIALALGGPATLGIVHYAHSEEGARITASKLRAAGGEAIVVRADLGTEFGATDLVVPVREVLAGRKLDTLILNAADTAGMALGSADPQILIRLLSVNVVAPTLIVDGLAERLNQDASIVALSIAATRQVFSPDFAFFAATKAAVDVMVKGWAVALGARGIRVNAVAPGVVEANFRAELLRDPAFRQSLETDCARQIRAHRRHRRCRRVRRFRQGSLGHGPDHRRFGGWRL